MLTITTYRNHNNIEHIKPTIFCAVSGVEITDATHANVIWVYKHKGGIIGDPIIVSKECSPRQIVDKHLGIEDDPSLRTQWLQLDQYLTTLCDNLEGLKKEPDLAFAEYE